MEKEIPVVVLNFELKQHELTTTAYPEMESESYVGIRSQRKKRFLTDLISLGIQGFTAFNTNRKVNQLKKGMKRLFKQHHLENKAVRLEDDMISLAHVAIEGLQHLQGELIRQGRHIRNLTSKVRRFEITLTNMNFRITDNTNAIRFLSSLFGLLLSYLNRYLRLYETILLELDHFLDALDNLSNSQLSHSVIPPKEMNDLIILVKDVLETTYPSYELIVSEVHDYYPFQLLHARITL